MVIDENRHHLVLGTLKDYLSNAQIPDTYDERDRQEIARLLVETLGYGKKNISAGTPLTITAGEQRARIKVDFIIQLKEKKVMLIKYAPGSLVTRQLSTLSLSRIVANYQIPFAVITNGKDALIIEGTSGQVIGQGLSKIPDKEQALQFLEDYTFPAITSKVFDQASRITFACEVHGACPCDTDVCIL